MSKQVAIATVPWTDTASPLMAPAVLKSALSSQGISAVTVDLNAEVRRWLATQEHRDLIIKFMLSGQIDPRCRTEVKVMIDMMANRLLAIDSTWIALSLLTYLSQIPAKWLCQRLKQLRPQVRIVIGGPGAFVTLKSGDQFANQLKKSALIDHYVSGDAEISLPQLIQGRSQISGVDSPEWQQIQDLDALPVPDFDDYQWHLYDMKKISIVGSRGCVRQCTFCDIHEHWNQYQWRSAESLFNEMQYQSKRHGINIFSFSDSLVNGNQKEFRKLISMLADHNRAVPSDQKIQWTGAFIIRPQDQMKENDWRLVADSGASMLSVGVESFVEHIRYHIGKKFTNTDLEFAFDMAKKYQIKLLVLMIVGYVTETQQDFDQALEWVRSHRHYANDPVKIMQIGSGLSILPNTWLDRNQKVIGIKINDQQVRQDWTGLVNHSTPTMRMEWHRIMKQCLKDNGFDVAYLNDNHVLIESYLSQKYD